MAPRAIASSTALIARNSSGLLSCLAVSVLLPVPEVIEALGSTYGAIDIRCVAAREGSYWVNLLAVLRLTYEDVSTAQLRLQNHVRRFKPIQTESLRIVSCMRPFSEWDRLCSGLQLGALHVEELRVALTRQRPQIDLSKAKGYLQW